MPLATVSGSMTGGIGRAARRAKLPARAKIGVSTA